MHFSSWLRCNLYEMNEKKSPFKKQLHLIVQVFLTWCHDSIHRFQISCLGGWGRKGGSLDTIFHLEQKPTPFIRLWYSLIKDPHLRIRIAFNMRFFCKCKEFCHIFQSLQISIPLKKVSWNFHSMKNESKNTF